MMFLCVIVLCISLSENDIMIELSPPSYEELEKNNQFTVQSTQIFKKDCILKEIEPKCFVAKTLEIQYIDITCCCVMVSLICLIFLVASFLTINN